MIPQLLQHEKASEPILQLPYISLLMPFDPRHMSKAEIGVSINTILRKVEKELSHTFPRYMIKPAVARLKLIVNSLDYNRATKSISVSLSPFNEKTVYLNFPVRERIVVGKLLNIKELLYQREEEKEFFAIKLGRDTAIIYWQQGATIKPIVINSMQQLTSNAKEPSLRDFIKYVDNNLSSILKAWKLPVIVVGNKRKCRFLNR